MAAAPSKVGDRVEWDRAERREEPREVGAVPIGLGTGQHLHLHRFRSPRDLLQRMKSDFSHTGVGCVAGRAIEFDHAEVLTRITGRLACWSVRQMSSGGTCHLAVWNGCTVLRSCHIHAIFVACREYA